VSSTPLACGPAAVLDVILKHELDVRREWTAICSGEFIESSFEARTKAQRYRLGLSFQ
jgi:hypothetical protein